MSLNLTTIENTLYAWIEPIATALSAQVIIANQNAPRPLSSYVLINIVESRNLGTHENEYTLLVDDMAEVDANILNEIFVSINTYYSGAFTLASSIRGSLKGVQVNETLYGSGLGYSRSTAIRNIPEEINKQLEERSQFDCFFNLLDVDTYEIETITKVETTNEINNDGDTVIIEKP